MAATMVMPPRKPGDGKGDWGVNAPAETIWAKVIVVFGSLSEISLSQGVVAISCAHAEIAKRNADAVLVIVRICKKTLRTTLTARFINPEKLQLVKQASPR